MQASICQPNIQLSNTTRQQGSNQPATHCPTQSTLTIEQVRTPPLERIMASFSLFLQLPPEIRLLVWRQYFLSEHGSRIHVFEASPTRGSKSFGFEPSYPRSPKYYALDASTHQPASDDYATTAVHPEALAAFRGVFHVGAMRCFHPTTIDAEAVFAKIFMPRQEHDEQSHAGSKAYETSRTMFLGLLQEDLDRLSVRFGVDAERDMVYVIDGDAGALLPALCEAAPWMQEIRRVAIRPITEAGEVRIRYHKLQALTHNMPPGFERFLQSPRLEAILLVTSSKHELDTFPVAERPPYGFRVATVHGSVIPTREMRQYSSHLRAEVTVRQYFTNLRKEVAVLYVKDVLDD
ncbi:hypothetical protein F4780DRAFT_362034 [Xylariomycetidae sp. FL0641]|nr:hypothetical protein F4780DRAFT_362034 [Xylariomycetidae sp. FL0641]